MNKFDYNGVRDQLKDAGIIKLEEELGALFGKGASYVSSRKSKNQNPSFDALVHLAMNLENDRVMIEAEIRNGEVSGDLLYRAGVLYRMQSSLMEEIRDTVKANRGDPYSRSV